MKVISFIKSSIDELTNQVTWPKTSELYSTTALVLIATLIFAVLIGVIDYGFQIGMDALYSSFDPSSASDIDGATPNE